MTLNRQRIVWDKKAETYILFCEVGPVCFSNTLWWVSGEGVGFGSDWLIPRCLSRQRKSVYSANAKPDELPMWMHLASPLYLDAYKNKSVNELLNIASLTLSLFSVLI